MVTAIQQNIRRWTAHVTGQMHPFSAAVGNVCATKLHTVNYSKTGEDLHCVNNS
jgi:hypothetical protein